MSGIRQIQVRYDAYEDRALLRLNSTDGAEFRFWITRSYARALWPQLVLAGAQRDHREANEPDAPGDSAQVDLSTPFDEDASHLPLGENPVLLARFSIQSAAPGEVTLGLHPLEGRGVDLRLEPGLLGQLARLIAQSARTAGWDLPDGSVPIGPVPRQAH